MENHRERLCASRILALTISWFLPDATVYGPKSAFRYARIQFLQGPTPLRFKAIHLDAIYYPVRYEGAFESLIPCSTASGL